MAGARQLSWRHMVQANFLEVVHAYPSQMFCHLLYCLLWQMDSPNILTLVMTSLIVLCDPLCLPFSESCIDIVAQAACIAQASMEARLSLERHGSESTSPGFQPSPSGTFLSFEPSEISIWDAFGQLMPIN